jgi:K+-sensing histidine kinase KdpD
LWFDFFLTRPYESFTITRSSDLQTTLLLFAVAVAVGEIAAHNRRNRTQALLTTSDLRGVQSIAHLLAAGAPVVAVTEAACDELTQLLSLESASFEKATDVRMPYIERSGCVRHSNYFTWDHAREGLPAKTVILPVEAAGRPVGRFALRGPTFGIPLSTDRLLTAVAVADLTGASIARSG